MPPDQEAELPGLIAKMRSELKEAQRQQYLILYLDETIFSRKAMLKTVWALKHENAEIDEAMLNEKTKALLLSISADNGVEPWRIYDKSVNAAKFCKYLDMVRERHPEQKICIFMDNLRVHTCKKVKAKLEELQIKAIYNVKYQCQLNPIELVFSKVKNKFKQMRAESLVRMKRPNIHLLITRSIKNLDKQDVVHSIEHVRKILYPS